MKQINWILFFLFSFKKFNCLQRRYLRYVKLFIVRSSWTNALNFISFNSIQNSHVHEPRKLVEHLQHLYAYYHREKSNLKSLSKLRSLGFSVLKYIVLTFCWHSIEASAAFAFWASRLVAGTKLTRLVTVMHRGLWNVDHASFFSEATLIEIGVYSIFSSCVLQHINIKRLNVVIKVKARLQHACAARLACLGSVICANQIAKIKKDGHTRLCFGKIMYYKKQYNIQHCIYNNGRMTMADLPG